MHAPYLAGCILITACALLWARRLERVMGGFFLVLYAVYLALNVSHMWR
jgi:Ca2+/Na+ antiporter